MLEYPSSIIDSETAKDNPDWEFVENCIREMGDEINKLDYDDGEETLLSAIIYDHAEYYGKNLLRLTELFLKHGYDVSANGGLNGGKCLHRLCECWVDYHVLPVMEMLLDAGDDISVENEDGRNVLKSIGFELGDWTDGDYKTSNLFEALYEMVASYSENKPYRGIRGYEECIGGTLRKVEKLTLNRATIVDDVTHERNFRGYLLFWIDDRPLIASVYPDFVINPNVVESAVNRMDISNEMDTILNGKFKEVLFQSAYESILVFTGLDQEDYCVGIRSVQCGSTMSDRRGIYDCGCLKGSPWEDDYGNRQR